MRVAAAINVLMVLEFDGKRFGREIDLFSRYPGRIGYGASSGLVRWVSGVQFSAVFGLANIMEQRAQAEFSQRLPL